MASGSNSKHGSPGWHTDPENPMLGPNGQLQDAHERQQQFVYSPLEAANKIVYLHDNTEDDLPAAFQVDVNNTRPKRIIKPITHKNPLEVFKQEKLAAKSKASSMCKKKKASENNKSACQETLNALSKFGLWMDCLKLPQFLVGKDGSRGAPIEVESSASEAESVKERHFLYLERGTSSKCC